MAHAVRISELYSLTPSEREAALARLIEEALRPSNGGEASIDARIREFELRYEMSSEELLKRLEGEQQAETDEIAEWLFMLQFRERVRGGAKARP